MGKTLLPFIKKFCQDNRDDILVSCLLSLVSFVKLCHLSGGLVLGEPDEFIHAEVAANFKKGWLPQTSVGPWFFELPLYPFLGYLASLFFPGKYLGLRVVSVLTSALLTLGIYFYLKYKGSAVLGFAGALIFTLSPLSVFYSRLALLDMATASFAMLFIFAFDYALEKRSKAWGILAGFFLSLSLLVKYSALIYCLVLGIYWLVLLWKKNKNLKLKETLDLEIISTLALIVLFIMIVPLSFILRRQNPFLFKQQLYTSLGFIKDFWRIKGGELTFFHYLSNLSWWLSFLVMILFLSGLPKIARLWRNFHLFWLSFFITILFVIPHTPFYPRYFFPLVPFIAIISGFGFTTIYEKLKSLKILKSYLLLPTSYFLLFLLFLPSSYEAFLSTNHNLIEDVGKYIKSKEQKDPWLFANYWPNYFGEAAESKRATWLADSVWEAKAFYPEAEKSPLEILEGEGGFVVLEGTYAYSPMFITPESRTQAWRFIEENYKPKKIIYDKNPNFPFYKSLQNKVEIYYIRGYPLIGVTPKGE